MIFTGNYSHTALTCACLIISIIKKSCSGYFDTYMVCEWHRFVVTTSEKGWHWAANSHTSGEPPILKHIPKRGESAGKKRTWQGL